MGVNAVYFALPLGNLLLIVASLFLGPRLLQVCRAAVFVNGIASPDRASLPIADFHTGPALQTLVAFASVVTPAPSGKMVLVKKNIGKGVVVVSGAVMVMPT